MNFRKNSKEIDRITSVTTVFGTLGWQTILMCFIAFKVLWAGVELPLHPQPCSQLLLESYYLGISNGRRQKLFVPRPRPPHI